MTKKNRSLEELLPCYSFIGPKTIAWVRHFRQTQGLSHRTAAPEFVPFALSLHESIAVYGSPVPTLEGCLHAAEFHATHMVEALFHEAVTEGVSDVHLEPEGGFIRLRYRKDGQLVHRLEFHQQYWSSVCVRLKVLAKLDIAEQRRPQNGRISHRLGDRTMDVRVSIHPTYHGENFVLRLLDPHQTFRSLEELQLSAHVLPLIHQVLTVPEGMVLVTGPTGSGKTTTLYAFLAQLSPQRHNIMTLEDPIEYVLPGARQLSIQEGFVSFAEGVRSILRQDPDIVLIGEIRDEATARMAIRAAMTGHQVFSTLHTRHALGALYRFQDLGLCPSLLAGHLNAIVTQRLVRQLCAFCRIPAVISRELDALFQRFQIPAELWQPQGCAHCHEGYIKRRTLAEILVIDSTFERLLMLPNCYKDVAEYVANSSFQPLLYDALINLSLGQTSLTEVQKVMGRLSC